MDLDPFYPRAAAPRRRPQRWSASDSCTGQILDELSRASAVNLLEVFSARGLLDEVYPSMAINMKSG